MAKLFCQEAEHSALEFALQAFTNRPEAEAWLREL